MIATRLFFGASRLAAARTCREGAREVVETELAGLGLRLCRSSAGLALQFGVQGLSGPEYGLEASLQGDVEIGHRHRQAEIDQ